MTLRRLAIGLTLWACVTFPALALALPHSAPTSAPD